MLQRFSSVKGADGPDDVDGEVSGTNGPVSRVRPHAHVLGRRQTIQHMLVLERAWLRERFVMAAAGPSGSPPAASS